MLKEEYENQHKGGWRDFQKIKGKKQRARKWINDFLQKVVDGEKPTPGEIQKFKEKVRLFYPDIFLNISSLKWELKAMKERAAYTPQATIATGEKILKIPGYVSVNVWTLDAMHAFLTVEDIEEVEAEMKEVVSLAEEVLTKIQEQKKLAEDESKQPVISLGDFRIKKGKG